MTTSELLTKAELALEAENIMALHCYYHTQGYNKEELEDIWVTKDEDVSWAQGFGARDSLSHMYLAYGLNYRRNSLSNYECLLKVYPSVKDYDASPLMEMAMHTLTTPMVEVADDLQTIKGWWYTPGTIGSNLNFTRRQEGSWMWERYAIDFLVEDDGEVKMQRASVLADITCPLDGGNWLVPRRFAPPEEDPNAEPPEFDPPYGGIPYEVPGPFHFIYSPTQTPQAEPVIPVPYTTRSETFLY